MIKYKFVMSHKGELPTRRCLDSLASDFKGAIIYYQDCYTGNCLQEFLDECEDLFDPYEHMGKIVTAKFNQLENLELFKHKLKGIRVRIKDEKIKNLEAAA